MNKQSYEHRVRALAEKMARNKYPITFFQTKHPSVWEETFYEKQREYTIELMMSTARIAVAEMAEIAKTAYWEGYLVKSGDMEGWLEEQGLIPDNAQEGAQNAP